MKIAIGSSRMEKKWKNEEISWEDFCLRVKSTIRTIETLEEYKKLPKIKQSNIKDVGGFVGGHLKDGRRKNGNVLCRSFLTLDMDYGRENIWDEINMLFDFKCCIYSTHKHTKENPRFRLIIPLLREINEDEYAPLARMVAKDIGIDLFDDSTYEASRLMYWPSTSSDGDFVYEESDNKLLDPNFYLGKYENYKDTTTWPRSSRESPIIKNNLKKQADPLLKNGVVGVFCHNYSITEAIDKFLSHVYSPSNLEGRYDFISAHSSGGLVLYDNKFAYSHHATDPARAKLMNAFDIVRIHKFGHLDEEVLENTPSNKLPSFVAMKEFATKDDLIKDELAKENIAKVKEEFGEKESNEKEDKVNKISEKELDKNNINENKWQMNLEFNNSGNIKDTLDNLVLILYNDENLQNIAFNCHSDGINARGPLPWKQIKEGWNDSDIAALKVYLSKKYKIYSPNKTKDAILSVATNRAYHPIKEYLESLPKWDNIPRVDNLLIDYFGANDSSYTKAVTRKTMVAAVSRIYNPGIKFDSVLILNGPQGIGKSTFFAKLAGNWFSDSLTITDMKDKCGPEKLQGYWILELGELAGIRKTEVEIVKSFISRSDDKYRASYGIYVENHPRQCIIVGSTNAESGFLRDITGNRRFWPVKVDICSKKKPWNLTKTDVEQIWAETMEIFHKGENLYLEGEDKEVAIKKQSEAMETDEREGLVRAYLDTLLPEKWDRMSIYERRNFLRGNDFGDSNLEGSVKRSLVCNMEIWCECFGNEPSSLKSSDSHIISSIITKIEKWNKYEGNKTGTKNFSIYGKQRCYEFIGE